MIGVEAAVRIVELTSSRVCAGFDVPFSSAASTPAMQDTAPSRLRRAAWLPGEHALTLGELHDLGSGLPRGIDLDLTNLARPLLLRADTARVLLNLLLMGADGLKQGGTIALAGENDDLFVRLVGPGAAWPGGLSAYLADETEALSALATEAGLQPAFTALLARLSGLRLSLVIPPAQQGPAPIMRLSR
jgi:hypothetical protein